MSVPVSCVQNHLSVHNLSYIFQLDGNGSIGVVDEFHILAVFQVVCGDFDLDARVRFDLVAADAFDHLWIFTLILAGMSTSMAFCLKVFFITSLS